MGQQRFKLLAFLSLWTCAVLGATSAASIPQLDYVDSSGRFQASEQHVEESDRWHAVLRSLRQSDNHSANFDLFSVNASFDSDSRRPVIPTLVHVGFEYRPTHLTERWSPKTTLFADNRYVCDLHFVPSEISGGPGRETEFGSAEIAYSDFKRLGNAQTIALRIDEVEVPLDQSVPEGFRWFAEWQDGSSARPVEEAQPN